MVLNILEKYPDTRNDDILLTDSPSPKEANNNQ